MRIASFVTDDVARDAQVSNDEAIHVLHDLVIRPRGVGISDKLFFALNSNISLNNSWRTNSV